MKTELTDGFVRIRPYTPDDADRLFEAVRESIAELSPWLPWCHAAYTREESESWIEHCATSWKTARDYPFLVEDPSTGRYLGGAGLAGIDHGERRGAIGYWVRTSETGRGVATAAAALAARFGFEQLRLAAVEILVESANAPSRRVAEKLGAMQEAGTRIHEWAGGVRREVLVYSLTPEDLIAP